MATAASSHPNVSVYFSLSALFPLKQREISWSGLFSTSDLLISVLSVSSGLQLHRSRGFLFPVNAGGTIPTLFDSLPKTQICCLHY